MQVVLVTGGSSGIGLATVRRLAAAGHRVFAASRNPERAPLPSGVVPITLDVGDRASAPSAIARVVDEAGRIDVLVNNAGDGVLAPIEETSDDDVLRTFEVNVFGPLRLARAAIPAMREQGAGRIINVTSMNDALPAPFGGYYSASKAALASASAVLDAEVRPFGVSVTVVAPGLFRTAMAEATGSFDIADDSPYRVPLEALRAGAPARIETAADPDIVAQAIEDAIEAEHPPARVVVGEDAEAMGKLLADGDAEQLASMLRAFVRALIGDQPSR